MDDWTRRPCLRPATSALIGRLTAAALALVLMSGCDHGRDRDRNTSTLDIGEWKPTKVVPSPDGRSTAVLASSPGHAFDQVLILRGGKLSVITGRDEQASNVAWMPGSQRVLVSFYGSGGTLTLRLHPLEGREAVVVPLATDIGNVDGMAVAHDGKTAIMGAPGHATPYSEPDDLFQVDLLSGRVENLTNTPVESEHTPSFVDEHRVAFNGGQASSTAGGPNGYAALFDLRTRTVSRLTEPGETVSEVAAATKGGWVAFRAFDGNARSEAGLWVLHVDTGSRKRLGLSEEAHQPRFLATGDEIVYVEVRGPGDNALKTVPVDLP